MDKTFVEIALLLGLITSTGEVVGAVKPVPATPVPTAIPNGRSNEYVVTSTSYNLLARQTDSTPNIAAWGDRLKPTDRICAVSRDLEAEGVTRGSVLRLPGYGLCTVMDRMHYRWRMSVDVLHPTEPESMQWGRQRNLLIEVVKR